MSDPIEDAAICDLLERLLMLINTRAAGPKVIPATLSLGADVTTVSIPQGGSVVITLTVAMANYRGFVAGIVVGLPTGVTAVFSNFTAPNAVVATGTLTLSADVDATPVANDSFSVIVNGANSLASNTLTCDVTVTAVVANAITVALDDTFPVIQRSSTANLVATITRLGGYSGVVTLAVTSLPAGVTASFPSGATLSGGTLTAPLQLSASADAALGAATAILTASGSGVTSVTVDININVTSVNTAVPYLSEYFDTYADEAAMLAQVGVGKKFELLDGVPENRLFLDFGVTYNGKPSLRHRYATGTNSKPRTILRNTPKSNIWIGFALKFTRGFSLKLNNGYTGAASLKITDFSQGGFPVSGSYGRSLLAFNGQGGANSNVPGADFNRGDINLESYSRTADPRNFLLMTCRNALQGAQSMFSDEHWYRFVQHWEWVSDYHHRTRFWIWRDDESPVLVSTHNTRDGNTKGPTTLNGLGFFPTFNPLSGPPIGPGVDQSVYLAAIEAFDGAVFSDPFSIGDSGTSYSTVDFTPVIDNASVSLAVGASTTRTITCSFGSSISDRAIEARIQGKDFPTLPTGLSFAINKTMTQASPSATLTISTTVSTPPGVYSMAVNMRSLDKSGTGGACNYVNLTITVT